MQTILMQNIRKPLLCLVLLLCFCIPVTAEENVSEKLIRIVSPEWKGATDENGEGFYFDFMRLVFEPAGYKIKTNILPYKRAIRSVLTKEADVWLAAYRTEAPAAYFPAWHMGMDRVTVVTQVDLDRPAAHGIEQLGRKNIGWVRGYGYENVILPNQPTNYIEVNNIESGFKMLRKGRLYAYLDAFFDVEAHLSTLPRAERAGYHLEIVAEQKTFPAFQNTSRGRMLAKIWDERIEAMVKDGSLRAFFQQEQYDRYPY